MAIDFNKQLVFDPKIEIVGEEVPLAAMEKTGAVLQDRYDKSYENYTKFQELAKQTEQIADPLEREKVKQYIKDLEPQIQDIAKKGDFHNMRWQTMALANNAANNLKLFGERAAEAKKYRDLISANDKIGDEETKAYYQNKLNKVMAETQYNPETKSFNFNALQLPKMVSDYDTNKFLQNVTQGWLADTYKTEAANMVLLKAGDKIPGVGGTAPVTGVYNTKTGKQDTKVDFNEIYNNALKVASGERGLQAMLQRDFEIQSEGKNLNPEQQMALKDSLTRKYLYDPLTGFANKSAYTQTLKNEDLGFDAGATKALGIGDNNKPPMGIPVNTLANAYGNIEGNLRENLVKGLTGQKGSLNAVMNFVNSKVANLPEDKQPKNYKEFKQVLNEVKNLTQEQQAALAPTFESVFKPGVTFAAANASLDLLKDPKLRSIQDRLLKNVGTYFSFDTEAENEFDNYVKENQAFQNINLLTPSYQDAESINKMQTWMDKSLAPNDFKSFKGEIDPKASYSLSKVSDRPVGNGTGIVIEFKNNKDNSTILVEPKDERMLYALESNFPGIVAANMFKNTSDFNAGEIRPISEIFKENNPSGKKENLFPKGYPDILKTSKIFYKDGMFMLLDSKGNPLQGQNGQPITSTSYLDLIQ